MPTESSSKSRVNETESLKALLADVTFESTPLESTLKAILDAACSLFEFNQGLVYFADDAGAELVCAAQRDFPVGTGRVGAPRYGLCDGSVPARVFNEGRPGGTTCITDLDAVDSRSSAFFGMVPPITGIPLILAQARGGAVVLWNPVFPGTAIPESGRLESFGNLATRLMGLTIQEERLALSLGKLPASVSDALGQVSQQAVLNSVTESLSRYPFDRVRVFEYVEAGCFKPITSSGMSDPGKFMNARIWLNKNPYARETAVRFRKSNVKPITFRPGDFPGGDPDAALLEKEGRDAPWVVAPLGLGEQLIGQIVVDNAPTGRPITPDAENYLRAISALAAGAIANRRSIQYVSLNSLPSLYGSLSPSDSQAAVIKKLLVYLTSGEALGFSRAVYFDCKDKPLRLSYKASVGSVTSDRFDRISREVAGRSLLEILSCARDIVDDDIDRQLKGFVIDLSTTEGAELLSGVRRTLINPRNQEDPPLHWYHSVADNSGDLTVRLNSEDVFTVPLHVQGSLFGAFLVDRKWQPPQPRADVDEIALRTFAQVASQILEQNLLHLRASKLEIDGQWEEIASYAAHECMRPTLDIGRYLAAMLLRLEAGEYEEAIVDAESIRGPLRHLFSFIDDFLRMGKRLVEAERLRLIEVLDEALLNFRKELEDKSIEVTLTPAHPGEPVWIHGDRTRLITSFREVIANAIFWCGRSDRLPRKILIEVRRPGAHRVPASLDRSVRYILIRVEDSGPGVGAEDEERVFELKFTRRPNEGGHGAGLFMVRRTLRAHGGNIYAAPGDKGEFFLFIPEADDETDSFTAEGGDRWTAE